MSEIVNFLTPKLKTQWIKALRSGKYMQGQGYLALRSPQQKKTRYCCLGVLASITGQLYSEAAEEDGYTEYWFGNDGSGSQEYIRDSREGEYCLLDTDTQHTLADMNDEPASFTKIAQYIEKNL